MWNWAEWNWWFVGIIIPAPICHAMSSSPSNLMCLSMSSIQQQLSFKSHIKHSGWLNWIIIRKPADEKMKQGLGLSLWKPCYKPIQQRFFTLKCKYNLILLQKSVECVNCIDTEAISSRGELRTKGHYLEIMWNLHTILHRIVKIQNENRTCWKNSEVQAICLQKEIELMFQVYEFSSGLGNVRNVIGFE